MTTVNAEKAPRITSFFAISAITCFAYALLTIIVLHVLRPDYAPASHMISDYGVGPYGWVMTTWFIATSCGCLMLLLGLTRSGLNSITARLGGWHGLPKCFWVSAELGSGVRRSSQPTPGIPHPH